MKGKALSWYRECRNTEGCGVRLEIAIEDENGERIAREVPDIGDGLCPVCAGLATEWKPGPPPEVDW